MLDSEWQGISKGALWTTRHPSNALLIDELEERLQLIKELEEYWGKEFEGFTRRTNRPISTIWANAGCQFDGMSELQTILTRTAILLGTAGFRHLIWRRLLKKS